MLTRAAIEAAAAPESDAHPISPFPLPISSREQGQALFILIIILTIIMVVGVIVVDVGLWISERRQAQSAADLAALSAATELRTSSAAAISKGLDFASRNGFDDASGDVSVVVNPGYSGNPDMVEVIIEEDSPALFGEIFGLANMSIGARAVASIAEGTMISFPYAVFADQSNCGISYTQAGLAVIGSDLSVTGQVHSNGRIWIDGSRGNYSGGVTYRCNNGIAVTGSSNNFNPPPQQARQRLGPPVTYSFSSFPCSVNFNGSVNLASSSGTSSLWVNDNPNSGQLRDNVICATGDIRLASSDITGRVTLVTQGKVIITGSDVTLTPNWNSVVLFSESSAGDALDIDGDDGHYSGYLLAPGGGAEFDGSSILVTGSVVAETATFPGSRVTVDASGAGQTQAPPTIWLVE